MPSPLPVNFALQGGGAHGAFTWGVLDALLEDGRLVPDAVSGTSAGAMNAVALAQGWMDGRAEGARAALRRFWTALAGTMPLDGAVLGPDGGVHLAPAVKLWALWSRVIAPSQSNPLGINPLRDLVSSQFDFERLRRVAPLRLFIAATHADSGRLRLFREHELGPDELLASACLPTVFSAPRIGGQPYWDGGYAGNPAVFPLLEGGRARDTMLVLLTPLELPPLAEAPTARDLQERIAEIAFTASFRREMQALARARRGLLGRWWPRRSPATARLHLIEAGPALDHLAADTRLAVSLKFFETLHGLGRTAAARWLAEDAHALGRRSSVDLAARFG